MGKKGCAGTSAALVVTYPEAFGIGEHLETSASPAQLIEAVKLESRAWRSCISVLSEILLPQLASSSAAR